MSINVFGDPDLFLQDSMPSFTICAGGTIWTALLQTIQLLFSAATREKCKYLVAGGQMLDQFHTAGECCIGVYAHSNITVVLPGEDDALTDMC
jgi:hypothetical protein